MNPRAAEVVSRRTCGRRFLARTEIPFDEMTKLGYLYVTNWSLAADMSLLLTLPSLTRARTAY